MSEVSARRIKVKGFGTIVAKATDNGVCSVELSASGAGECKEVSSRESKHLDQFEKETIEYFKGSRREFKVAVDLDGVPPFTTKVLKLTSKIKFGKTRSYGEIAKAVRNPTASRAVGQAMGRNPVPLIIPCHRVTGSCGKLGGFSGGIEMKKTLLKIEGKTDLK